MARRGGKGGRGGSSSASIVIRREEIVEDGHHGGAWKVAYADFVTAMMAFFLLMWLINATTEEQRRGIAAYFNPMADTERGKSGTGLLPGAATPFDAGSLITSRGAPQAVNLSSMPAPVTPDDDSDIPATQTNDKEGGPATDAAGNTGVAAQVQHLAPPGKDTVVKAMLVRLDSKAKVTGSVGMPPAGAMPAAGSQGGEAEQPGDAALHRAAQALQEALHADPALAASAGQVRADVTPEGLRIQIMDAAQKPMFDSGKVTPNDRATALLRKLGPFLRGLHAPVAIAGHTDGAAYPAGAMSNWSLSTARADAATRVMMAAGLPREQIVSVSGYADRQLLHPDAPLDPSNRRIVIIVQRPPEDAPTAAADGSAPKPPTAPAPPTAPLGAAGATATTPAVEAAATTTPPSVPATASGAVSDTLPREEAETIRPAASAAPPTAGNAGGVASTPAAAAADASTPATTISPVRASSVVAPVPAAAPRKDDAPPIAAAASSLPPSAETPPASPSTPGGRS